MNSPTTSVKILNTPPRTVEVTKIGHPPMTFGLFNGLATGFADATELRQKADQYRKSAARMLRYADLCEDAAALVHHVETK